MTALTRVISATVAAWTRLLVNIFTQIISVPVFLHSWGEVELGIWFALQSFIAIIQSVDISHQSYIEAEFLKAGPRNKAEITQIFSDAIPIALLLAFFQLCFAVILVTFDALPYLFGLPDLDSRVQACKIYLILSSVCWLLFGSVGGIAVRALTPLGYFPRLAWWGVLSAFFSQLSPFVSAIFGSNFTSAIISYFVANSCVSLATSIDLIRLMQKEHIGFSRIRWYVAFRNLGWSMVLLIQGLSDNLRHQGVRLIIAPVSGASAVAAFSTMKTFSNITMQGIGTITNSLLPELMHIVRERSQYKFNATITGIWLLVVMVVAPSLTVLQFLSEHLFMFWTSGKLAFDPLLLAIFSCSVLLSASIQPATLLIRGHNLVLVQVVIGLFPVIITLTALYILVTQLGFLGAAIGLLLGDFLAALLTIVAAYYWANSAELRWPKASFMLLIPQLLFTAISLILIATTGTKPVVVATIIVSIQLMWACVYARSTPLWGQLLKYNRKRVSST